VSQLITLALAAGCASSPAAQPHGGANGNANTRVNGNANGTGPVISANNGNGSQSEQATGSWTVAFARCMRAHGVPNFPDPNGQGGQLGPGSGIDPRSPQYQAALHGPCLSLAPVGWVTSGTVTK
jgi:hypothetical protein